MRIVKEPRVSLIAKTEVDADAISKYLLEEYEDIGVQTFEDTGIENLIEFSGRLCYRSFREGLNANVTKVRKGNKKYIGNILSSKHGSVLEHSSATFLFWDVSRVFTHELVRHRAGVAISQESLRYVRLTDISVALPDFITEHSTVGPLALELIEKMEEFQKVASYEYQLDNTKDFSYKKKITSGLRRLAPIGLTTAIVWTVNMRALRHILALRTAHGAEEEIKRAFDIVGSICEKEFPNIFQDFLRDADGQWLPEFEKV